MREIEILVEEQNPQGVFVCDHAGLVINKFSYIFYPGYVISRRLQPDVTINYTQNAAKSKAKLLLNMHRNGAFR